MSDKIMSDKLYDLLNLLGRLFVPVSTFIGTICAIWNVPYAKQITASLAAVDVLIGGIILVAKHYYDKRHGISEEGDDNE